MTIQINGTSGISGVDGSAATPALQGSDTNTGISFGTDEVNINTGGTNAITVDSSQQVGLGTSSPSGRLHVIADGIASGAGLQTWGYDVNQPNYQLRLRTDVSAGVVKYNFNLLNQATEYDANLVLDRGNVGIGTTTPLASSGFTGVTTSGSTGGILWFAKAGAQKGYIYGQDNDVTLASTDPSGVIRLLSGGNSERARIDSSGRLFYGTTSTVADARICLKGDFGSNRGVAIVSNQSSADMVWFQTSSGAAGKISSSGTSTTYSTSSDYRLKENIIPLTDAADRVNQLQVYRFNFLAEPEKTVDGFIAHEVQDYVPEAILGTKDEVDADGNPVYQGIDQSKLVPLLTAALQEALAKIETFEARLTALEGGINP